MHDVRGCSRVKTQRKLDLDAPTPIDLAFYDDLVRRYLTESEAGGESEYTTRIRNTALQAFRAHLASAPRDLLTEDAMKNFVADLMLQGKGAGSAEMWARASRTFLNWARSRGLASAEKLPLAVRSRRRAATSRKTPLFNVERVEQYLRLVEVHVAEPLRTILAILPYTNAPTARLTRIEFGDIKPRKPFALLNVRREPLAIVLPPGCQRLGRYLRDVRPRMMVGGVAVFPTVTTDHVARALADINQFLQPTITTIELRNMYLALSRVYPTPPPVQEISS